MLTALTQVAPSANVVPNFEFLKPPQKPANTLHHRGILAALENIYVLLKEATRLALVGVFNIELKI